jgi:hypothetical protein
MAWSVQEIGSQTGRTAVVTGANSGLGSIPRWSSPAPAPR